MVVFFTFLCPVQLPSLDHQYLSPSSEADVHFQPPQQHLRAKINFHHAALFYYFNGLVLLGVRHTLPMNKKLVNVSLWSCFIHMSPDCLNTKLLCYTSHWQTLSTVLSQRLISFLEYGVWGGNTHMGWQQHIVSRHQIIISFWMVRFLKHETLVQKTVVETYINLQSWNSMRQIYSSQLRPKASWMLVNGSQRRQNAHCRHTAVSCKTAMYSVG